MKKEEIIPSIFIMNYVNLTSDDYNLGTKFNEVGVDEKTRIDAVIADLDELCTWERITTDSTRRREIYTRVFELCAIGGAQFILLKASENLLYSKSDIFQEAISWIQRTTHYQFEVRGVCSQGFEKEQQIESFTYFILFYPSQNDIVFNDFDYIYCEKNYSINNSINKYNYIIDYIFAKIKEGLL